MNVQQCDCLQKEVDVRTAQIQQQKIEINRLRRELMVGVNSATYIFHWGMAQ